MTKAEFIKKLEEKHIMIIDRSINRDGYYVNMWMRRVENLKRLTGRIDFGCKFDKNGKCNAKNTSYKNERMCCCTDCAFKIGYLNLIYEKDVYYYTKKYNKKTGFWRKGKGCILDRHMRSNTCVTYVCGVGPNGLQDELKSLENAIRDYQNDVRKKVYEIRKERKKK
jgi:hypothetical protein